MNRFTSAELQALAEVRDELVPYVPYGASSRFILTVMARESDFTRLARNPSGAFGYFQRIDRSRPGGYKVADGPQQIRDYGAFTLSQIHTFMQDEEVPNVGAFYCLNLAPARVRLGILYAGPGPYYCPADIDEVEWQTYMRILKERPEVVSPQAYASNLLFDVPWKLRGVDIRKGFIRMEDLEPSLEKAVKRNQPRFDLELAALEDMP